MSKKNGHQKVIEQLAIDKVQYIFGNPGTTEEGFLDALWHGFNKCASILINANARLDLLGHDRKLPIDIAIDVFGIEHSIINEIRTKMQG